MARKKTGTQGCVFCGAEIDAQRDYRRVNGFVKHRPGGGANAVRLKTTTDDWACRWCVDKQASGNSANQLSIM